MFKFKFCRLRLLSIFGRTRSQLEVTITGVNLSAANEARAKCFFVFLVTWNSISCRKPLIKIFHIKNDLITTALYETRFISLGNASLWNLKLEQYYAPEIKYGGYSFVSCLSFCHSVNLSETLNSECYSFDISHKYSLWPSHTGGSTILDLVTLTV